MNNRQVDTDVAVPKEAVTLDDTLRLAWDKVRAAVLLINQLREEKHELHSHVRELEQKVLVLSADILSKEQEVKRLRAEHTSLVSASANNGFTLEDRENIKGRIRDLISKINSYL